MTKNQKKCSDIACQVIDIMRGMAMGQAFLNMTIEEQRPMIQSEADMVAQLMNEMHIAAEDIGE